MNFSRIANVVDIGTLQQAIIGLVGAGGSAGLATDLVRTGVGNLLLIDPDRVDVTNVARQAHNADQIGIPKVKALGKQLKRINPDVQVRYLPQDFCAISDEMIDEYFADVDLLIFATDHFPAQARGNEVALRLNKPAEWIGLYRGGMGGEIAFWHDGIDACFHCLCKKRYEAHETATRRGRSIDPASDGATIFDIHFLDSIAGMVAVGLLTRGSNNRFGRLIGELGDRNFIQVKIAPDFSWRGRDVIREQLGIAEDCDAFFAWNAIARRDPDGGRLYCADCERFRGHRFVELQGNPVRLKNGDTVQPEMTLSDRELEDSHEQALQI